MRDKICILMSTYNGARFVIEQIESLCHQEVDADVILYLRDDGSQDQTVQVVNEYFNQNQSSIEVIIKEGRNLGVHRSFLELLYNAPNADYYAFCDQDDFWKPDKLQTALSHLCNKHYPVLFYSGYEVVDEYLNNICNEPILGNCMNSVIQILFQNRVPGCVMVFNKELRAEIMKLQSVKSVRMHDAYVLCIAYLTGKIIYDKKYLIQYRQHESNALGYGSKRQGIKVWIKNKWKLLKEGDGYDMSEVAEQLYVQFHDIITEQQKTDLKMISEYKQILRQKIRFLSSVDIRSLTNKSSTISVFCRILLNVI